MKLTPALVYTGEMIRIAKSSFPENVAIGRLLLQKIAFFAQMAGLPIQLQFKQYNLGPYDRGLNFNVDRLEGFYVRDASPTHAKSDLMMLNEQEWLSTIEHTDIDLFDARRRIQHSINFLKKFPLGQIELLSTVLFAWASVAACGSAGTDEEVIQYVKQWKPGKFSDSEIQRALDQLIGSDWIDALSLKEESSVAHSDPILL